MFCDIIGIQIGLLDTLHTEDICVRLGCYSAAANFRRMCNHGALNAHISE